MLARRARPGQSENIVTSFTSQKSDAHILEAATGETLSSTACQTPLVLAVDLRQV